MTEEQQNRFRQQIEFLLELDRMKNIYRQTMVLHEDRFETDSEHAWHLGMLAMVLAEYSKEPVNTETVLETVLIHDIVEIDAGDTYAYDRAGNATKAEREQKAAERLFGMLPYDQSVHFRKLWEEFEAQSTPEARFANALDRLQPLMLNYAKGGLTWKSRHIRAEQVRERVSAVQEGSELLGDFAMDIIRKATEAGMLTE